MNNIYDKIQYIDRLIEIIDKNKADTELMIRLSPHINDIKNSIINYNNYLKEYDINNIKDYNLKIIENELNIYEYKLKKINRLLIETSTYVF